MHDLCAAEKWADAEAECRKALKKMDGLVLLGFALIGLYSAVRLWFRGKKY